MIEEQAVLFPCEGEDLLGILHLPSRVVSRAGVLLVVGGPQYRVGSHRQFTLLARALAGAGIPVFRFDYRGMGDSSGAARDFEAIDADIDAALNTFMRETEAIDGVVLWGLCDAASANAFYADADGHDQVLGQVALNPWVRTPEGEAKAYVRHYYLQRLLSPAFWRKLLTLQMNIVGSISDFLAKLRRSKEGKTGEHAESDAPNDARPLPERLRTAQLGYAAETLIILSGQDLTAGEYLDRVAEDRRWQAWFESSSVSVRRLDAADHTFSRAAWRDQVVEWTRDWIMQRFGV